MGGWVCVCVYVCGMTLVCVCISLLVDFPPVEVDCHSNSIFDISWVPGGTKLVSGLICDICVCIYCGGKRDTA